MKLYRTNFSLSIFAFLTILTASALGTVNATSPASGATVVSPVTFAGTASTTTCPAGVASMGVYIDDKLTYAANGTSINTSLPVSSGSHKTVIEEWDYCGGATFVILPITVTTQTGVLVTSPANNSTVGSPVQYTANASTSTCAKGVAAMGVYVNNQLNFVSQGAALNTAIFLAPGNYNTVVEEWDYCGGASYTPVTVTVPGKMFSNLQASGGWVGYGELPPAYNICSPCGPGVTYSMTQGITSPSLSGKATQFNLGGTTPYSDALWTNPLIGDLSSQGLPDTAHKLVPSLHYFTYDLYFYGSDLETSQVLEFDINQYFGGMSFIWGQQCRIAGGHQWDVWDNLNSKWVSTGAPCHPASNSWNHVTIAAQRTSDNWLYFQSITLNGVTTQVNRYYQPNTVPAGWNGITVNFQTDGNYLQSPYSVMLDNFSFVYR